MDESVSTGVAYRSKKVLEANEYRNKQKAFLNDLEAELETVGKRSLGKGAKALLVLAALGAVEHFAPGLVSALSQAPLISDIPAISSTIGSWAAGLSNAAPGLEIMTGAYAAIRVLHLDEDGLIATKERPDRANWKQEYERHHAEAEYELRLAQDALFREPDIATRLAENKFVLDRLEPHERASFAFGIAYQLKRGKTLDGALTTAVDDLLTATAKRVALPRGHKWSSAPAPEMGTPESGTGAITNGPGAAEGAGAAARLHDALTRIAERQQTASVANGQQLPPETGFTR